MVTRKAYSINRNTGDWVAQEMDTNTGDMADDMLDTVWLLLKWVVFLPVTLAWYAYKHFKENRRERL